MYPAIVHVAEAQLADWRQQAERYSIARAARLNRKRHRRRFVPGELAPPGHRRQANPAGPGTNPR